MGVILFFSGQSVNNVMTNRVRLDARLLVDRGYEVVVVDLMQQINLPNPADLDLIVGYQGWGHDIKMLDGRSYVEQAGCPFIVTLGDHPIHHASRISACPPKTVFCVSSRNQIDFLNRVFPHGTQDRLLPSSMSDGTPVDGVERSIGAVVVGHVKSPDAFIAEQGLPPVLVDIVCEFADRSHNHPHADPVADYMENGYERVLGIVGNQPSAFGVGRLVDIMVRHRFRWDYVQALRTLPVTFVGDDWLQMPRQPGDEFSALPSMAYSELRTIYARAQLCLNLHPPHFDFHERIIDAMVQSTAVATPKTQWLSECMRFGEEIIALPDKPDDVAEWLGSLLDDMDRLAQIGERGNVVANEKFGRQAPVDVFLEILHKRENGTSQAAISPELISEKVLPL